MGAGLIASIALDFVDQISDLDDEHAVRDLLLLHGRRLGFDRLAVAELPHSPHPPLVYLCNWPAGFYQDYVRRLYRDDPFVRRAQQTTEPFEWSEVHVDRSKGSPAQRFIDEIAEAGFETGFVVPIVSVEGEQSVVGMTGRRMKIAAADRHALHLMCVYAHHAVKLRRMKPTERERIKLTPAERNFLSQAINGLDGLGDRVRLSRRDTARLTRTVTHSLGVRTLAEAAAKAALLRLISI